MSAGDYPFSTLTGTNLLDQIVAPKIVWGGSTGYVVQADLGNLDTIYSTRMGSTSNPINQINATTIGTIGTPVSNLYATNIGDPNGSISTLYVRNIGAPGIRQPNGPRVSDIYVDTLHYLNLDPVVSGGTVTGVGNTGPTGIAGINGVTGATGSVGATGVGISGTTLSNGNLIITYTNGVTANAGFIQGPTGTQLFISGQVITSPFGTPASITQTRDSNNLFLQFSIPAGQPGIGFTGNSGGSGAAFSAGSAGQMLYYDDSGGGVTGNNNLLYDADGVYGSTKTFYTPGALVSADPATEIFLNTDAVRTYLQPGTASSSGAEMYVNKPYLSINPAAVFDTDNNRISVNKLLDDPIANPYTTLDIAGQTKITYAGSSIVTATAIPQTTLSGSTSLPTQTGVSYRIYGWGDGGLGPNAFAGGEIEYNTNGTTINWNYSGGGTGVFSGGNGLFLFDTSAPNPTIPVAVAYGGGGGYTGTTPNTDPSAGGEATLTVGGQGGRIVTNQVRSPQIYDVSSVSGLTASINSAILSNFSSINLTSGTTLVFSRVVQNAGGVLIIPPNTTCSINTSNATLTAAISSVYPGTTGYGTGITGISFTDGFFIDTVRTANSLVTTSLVGTPAIGVFGDAVAATGTTNTRIDGKNVNIYGVTGFSARPITWSNVGFNPGAIINFPNGGGFLMSPATNVNDIDARNFTVINGNLTLSNFLNLTSFTAFGSLTTNISLGPGARAAVQGFGSNTYAGSGLSLRGGTAIFGGGGGGGFYGGGGGYFNIGGNGSSFGTITNDGYQIYPYINKYNKNVYGGPRQRGGIVIETTIQQPNGQPALIVNGNELLNGSLTIGGSGVNLTVPTLTTQNLQIVSCASLTTAGTANIAGPLSVQNGGMTIANGNLAVNSGNFTTSGTITAGGNITTSGDVIAFSDRRMKENIEGIESPLEKIMKMHGVYFTRINNPRRQIGVIAQEVEEVLPEVVFTDESSNKNKSVSYGNIVALLIEGMKEQQKMIEDLKVQKDRL